MCNTTKPVAGCDGLFWILRNVISKMQGSKMMVAIINKP